MKVDDPASAPQASFVSVALDSTKLISADSFLFDARGFKDPRAKSDFQFVTTVFCNESAPYFAAPKSGNEQPHATELLKLWQRSATRRDILDLTLEDDKLFVEMASIFAREFQDPGKAADLAKWVQYQLTCDDLVEVFWEGGNNIDNLKTALSYVDPLIGKKHPLSQALNQMNLQVDASFSSGALGSLSNAAIAKGYAFFAFRKGRDYVLRLPAGVNYMPHWLRVGAQPNVSERYSGTGGEFPATFFPWGKLLIKLLNKAERSFHVGGDSVAALLNELRNITIREQPYKEITRTYPEKRIEKFVIEALHDASGWIPPKRRSILMAYGSEVAREVVPAIVQKGLREYGVSGLPTFGVGVGVETIVYLLESKFVRPAEFAGRRCYNRLVPSSNALQVYSSKEIRQTARAFIEGVRDASGAGDLTPPEPRKWRGKAKSTRV